MTFYKAFRADKKDTKIITTQRIQHVDVEEDKSYELMLPVSFKPKASKMKPNSTNVTIHSNCKIDRIINLANDQPVRIKPSLSADENEQNFNFDLIGDVHLRIYYKNVLLPNVSGNHGQRIT